MSQFIYFKQINNNIQFTLQENGEYETILEWPFVVNYNNVYFNSNIVISQTTSGALDSYDYGTNTIHGCTGFNIFLICGKNNITFGNTATTKITIDGITGYYGFIQNGVYNGIVDNLPTTTNMYNNITINNISMHTLNNSNLGINLFNTQTNSGPGGGWLCQPYFGYTANIDKPTSFVNNCVSNASISSPDINYLNGLGGIIGNNSSIHATNCKFTGSFETKQSGGIFGAECYHCIADSCVSGFADIDKNISDGSGGIFGANCTGSTGYNCKNYYILSGEFNGGIFGAYSKSRCYAFNCSNYGIIGGFGFGIGGIFGSNSVSCTASNCFNYGDNMSTQSSACSGGIFGGYANSSNAINCYNIGAIIIINQTNTPMAGGIFGGNCNNSTATNCYNSGDVGNYCGGIFGGNCTNSVAINCYNSSGNDLTNSSNSGGIFSNDAVSCSVSNCYSLKLNIFGENSSNSQINNSIKDDVWNDSTANSVLQIIYWISVYPNTPYLLSSFNNNFYNEISAASINVNNYTSLTLTQSGNYFYIFPQNNNVDINSNLTDIKFGQLTSSYPNNYNLQLIRTQFKNNNTTLSNSIDMYGYNIINFQLTVNNNHFFQNNYSVGYDVLKKFIKPNNTKYVKRKVKRVLNLS